MGCDFCDVLQSGDIGPAFAMTQRAGAERKAATDGRVIRADRGGELDGKCNPFARLVKDDAGLIGLKRCIIYEALNFCAVAVHGISP